MRKSYLSHQAITMKGIGKREYGNIVSILLASNLLLETFLGNHFFFFPIVFSSRHGLNDVVKRLHKF